ncbi:MAG: hypothetical protein L3J74_01640 [Bacteroidales bacterium]|nr:hypothetical protein [Bacteroidales bacterium]
MKKVLLSMLILFITKTVSINAQGNTVDLDASKKYVFWFYIKAEIKMDRELHMPIYTVRRVGKEIKGGTLKKYNRDVWRNINGGNQLCIGPFSRLEDAKRANQCYNLGRKTDATMQKEIENTVDTTDNTYYWYTLEFEITKRTHRYLLSRIPAAVSEGSLKAFKETLWSLLRMEQKKLTVGPFTNQEDAEVSKMINRNEESLKKIK